MDDAATESRSIEQKFYYKEKGADLNIGRVCPIRILIGGDGKAPAPRPDGKNDGKKKPSEGQLWRHNTQWQINRMNRLHLFRQLRP